MPSADDILEMIEAAVRRHRARDSSAIIADAARKLGIGHIVRPVAEREAARREFRAAMSRIDAESAKTRAAIADLMSKLRGL